MVYLQTLNYLPIILIISADKNEIMPICKEKEKYEHMQLIADYADKPSYLQICLFIGRYCRYTDKPIYGNAKSADTDIVSAAYLQIVSADNFIGCSLAAVLLLNHLYIILILRLISRDPYDFAEIQQITRL